MMRKKYYVPLVLFFTILFVNPAFSTDFSDSLENIIDISTGKEKIEAQLELVYYLRQANNPRALELVENALQKINLQFPEDRELKKRALYYLGLVHYSAYRYQLGLNSFFRGVTMAMEDNDNYLLARLYYYIGASHYYHYGDHSQAINYYNQSIQSGLMSNNYMSLGTVYSALSNMFRISGSYEKALEFIYSSREYYTRANHREGIAWVEYLIGSIYNSAGLNEEAKAAYSRSLDIYRELAAKDSVLTGVAICLDQLGVVNNELNNLDMALKYHEEAYRLYKIENSFFGMSNSLKYRADIQRKFKNYDAAEALLDSSLAMKKVMNDNMGLTGIYSLYGAIFIDNGDYQRALDSLLLGLKFANRNKQIHNKIKINRYIARAYESLGIHDKAYEYKSREVSVADSIFNSKTTRNMLQLETLYEIESKEKQIMRLDQEKKISELSLKKQKQVKQYLFAIIILAIVIIFLFVYFLIVKIRSNMELLESKQLVEETNAMKDKFFSILAHDLRNPFNSILGLTRILKTRHRNMSDEEIDKITDSLFQSSSNSYSLLNNLLEWSRTQRGIIKFNPERLSLNDLLKDVKHQIQSNADMKGITIVLDEKPVSLDADKNMLHTIFRNLLTNAIKYSNHGDTVTVSVQERTQDTLMTVSDSGIGMSSEVAAQLFKIDENYHIDGTEGEKGTGLGLIICKDFIDKHHGRIWVESEPGKGSSFHFTIPKNI